MKRGIIVDVHCHCSSCSTPLVKLNRISEETNCNILVKAEHLNPGGSVKDRAALFLIRQAEQTGGFTHCIQALLSSASTWRSNHVHKHSQAYPTFCSRV